jgi:putative aldouronate transport system substrate-binding protein
MTGRRIWIMTALAIGLVAAMLLSGCAPAATATPTTKAEATPTTAPELEPVDLTWYVIGTPQSDQEAVDAAISKITMEKIKANVKIITFDWGTYSDKMKTMAATGEEYDLCFTSSWANEFYSAASKGAFLEIDSLLEKYGKSILAQVPEEYWGAVTVKGKKYAMFNYQISVAQNGLFVQKALAEKYGLDVSKIKKIEDFDAFFDSVLKNEAGITPLLTGGGLIPLFNYETGYKFDRATQSWALPLYIRTDDPDFKVFNIGDTQENKDRSALMRAWYNKGYLRKDAASITDPSAEAKTGKYAAWVAGTIKPGGEIEETNRTGIPVIAVPIAPAYTDTTYVIAAMTAISRTSKNPERAMMLFDLMYSDKELYNLVCNGIKDKHYTQVDANYIKPIADSGYAPNTDWVFGGQFNAYLKEGMALDTWTVTDALNKSAAKSPLIGFIYDREAMKDKLAQLEAITQEYTSALATGTVDPDKVQPELDAKLKAAGLDEVIADIQKQIDAWRAENGK